MIPICFYHDDIIKLIDYQIKSEGHKNFNNINEIDKNFLSAECIKILGQDSFNSISEDYKLITVIEDLVNYLKKSSNKKAIILAKSLKDMTVNHFNYYMKEIFDERLTSYNTDILIEFGYKPNVDKINGEISWIK